MLDTPEHAHQILHSLEAAHGALLKALPRQMDGAGPSDTLASLVAKGTAPGASHSVAVDAALDMIEELRRCTKARTVMGPAHAGGAPAAAPCVRVPCQA